MAAWEPKPAWVLAASVLVGGAVAAVLWHRPAGPPRAPAAASEPSAPTPAAPAWRGEHRLVGVVEDERGEPLANVEVRATPAVAEDGDAEPAPAPGDLRAAYTRSGPDGRFELGSLPAGLVELEAKLELHERAVLPRVEVPADGPLRIVLERTAALSGEVLDPSGEPAPGARVTIAGSGLWPPRTLDADDDGRFRISPLPAGVYEARAGLDALTSDPQEGIAVDAGQEAFVSIALIPGVSLRGRVHDAQSGEPIADARITVWEDALTAVPEELLSDAEGRFALNGLRPLPHRVSILAEGYVALAGETRSPGDEELTFPIRRAGALVGRVLDADGEAVPDAELEILGTTDVGGALHMSPAALRFQRDMFETRMGGGPIGASADNLGVTRGAVPKIPLVAGSALATAGGAERPDAADVEESILALRSDADGRFRIEGVPPGRVQVLARKTGYAAARSVVHRLRSGETLQDVEVVLARGGRLLGRVLDGGGFPVEAARVQLELVGEPLGRMALSGRDGSFAFDALRGPIVVTAHRTGSPPVRESVTVPAGGEVEVELVFAGEARELAGRVLGTRGFPVPGALVRVTALDARSPVSRTTTSAADGTFVVQALPEPPYRVRVEHSQYAPLELDAATPDARGGLELQLSPGATLTGHVFDGFHDTTLSGVQLELVGVDAPERHRARSDTSGTFRFRNLRHGHYLLLVKRNGFVSTRREAQVEGDLEIERIDMTPAGGLSGEVVDRFGEPVFNAEVAVGEPPRWGSATESTRTDHRGQFTLRGLGEGDHLVHARHAQAGRSASPVPARVYTLQMTPGLVLRLPEEAREGDGVEQGGGAGAAVQEEGVGVRLGFRDGLVVVDAVAAGSRAEAAGLRRGDAILSIDDEPVHVSSQARAMLRGPAGSSAVLDVRRGQRVHRMLLTRELYRAP